VALRSRWSIAAVGETLIKGCLERQSLERHRDAKKVFGTLVVFVEGVGSLEIMPYEAAVLVLLPAAAWAWGRYVRFSWGPTCVHVRQ
jgi:hypothetical protein